MKNKFKSKLIMLLIGIVALLTLGGCTFREKTVEEALANRNLGPQVTYYANGGTLNSKRDKLDLYYPVGAPAYNIGVDKADSGAITVERNQYIFDGWYFARQVDSSGNPVYADSAKTSYALGKPVDFSVRLEEGDHWHLVAKWTKKISVNVVVSVEGGSVQGTDKAYQNGEFIENRVYDTKGEVVHKEPALTLSPSAQHQFAGYYMDAACKTPVVFPIKQSEQTNDVTVYAKYIDKSWTVVNGPTAVENMFKDAASGKKYWLASDIDMASRDSNTAVSPLTSFNSEIQGNGFTIKNLKVSYTLAARGSFSLFGEIAATAKMKNLSFSGLQMNYTVNRVEAKIYFVFTKLAEGAEIENVSLAGKMTLSKMGANAAIQNISKTDYTKCLYGGYDNDQAYLTASNNQGFKVQGEPKQFITLPR